MSDYFLNTVLVVGGSLIGTLLLGSMAAYVLARFDFPGNRFIYFLFIGGMSFPVMLALVPLFFVVNNIGLLNTLPRADPGLHRLLAAVHGLLPHRVLPDAADVGGRGGVRRRRLAHPDVLPGHAADGQARPDQRRHLQLPRPVEPVHAADGAQHADPDKRVLTQGLVQLAGQPGLQGRLVRTVRGPGDGDAAGARRVHHLPAAGGGGTDRRRAQVAASRRRRRRHGPGRAFPSERHVAVAVALCDGARGPRRRSRS